MIKKTPENQVECIGRKWIVRGYVGCPSCTSRYQVQLEIPETFLKQLIEEGMRRQREEAAE